MAAVEPFDDGGVAGRRQRRAANGKATILTPEVHARLINALRAGATVRDACDYAGVYRDRFYEWCRRGRAYDERLATAENAGEITEYEEIFRQFYLAAETARVEARVRANITLIDLMADTQPPHVRYRASVFILERTDRKNWGRTIGVTGGDGGPIEVDVNDRASILARQIREHIEERAAEAQAIVEAEVVAETLDSADDYDIWWSPNPADATWWPDADGPDTIGH